MERQKMTKPVLNELDYRLSGLRRFALLPVSRQSVAEHSFNVARAAHRIWVMLGKPCNLGDLLTWAIHHDDPESLSTDIPTMVKPYFDEERFIADHRDLLEHPCPSTPEIKRIVKLADMLEGYHFLCRERTFGNIYVMAHIQNYPLEIKRYFDEAFPDATPDLRGWLIDQIIALSAPVSKRISRAGR
jgi:5'-deoxynucleotidase YfbR-like HD superfamily hydrolase